MKNASLPRHVAIIMDGNGRWAKQHKLQIALGHRRGVETLRAIIRESSDLGIEALSLYAFSTENWKRPKHEVEAIFKLFADYIDNRADTLMKRNVKLVFIGDRSVFSDALRSKMDGIEKRTENNKKLLFIGINYGGRAEICHAVNELIAEGKTYVTEDDISAHMYTRLYPDPDLIVRTGGEYRLSNFLLWQSAYSELYITDTLWPDMTGEDVDKAINEFNRRNRRYGGI